MRAIERKEILPLDEYTKLHQKFRSDIIAVKEKRRFHLGPFFTFLFENRQTVIYQIQEMIRVESIQDEKAIQHEIDTYNQILPGKDELTSTLLIEIEDAEHRKVKLKELLGLEKHLFFTVDNEKIPIVFDNRQLDEERISSVQFLRIPLGEINSQKFLNSNQVKVSSTHPHYTYSSLLDEAQLSALKDDMS